MTSIKPPGGKSPLDSATGASLDGADALSSVEGEARTEAPAGVASAGAAAETEAIAPADLGAVDALSADLVAGRISPDAAVDVLVQRALSDVAGVLSPDQLRDLEATLRAALADDPTLSALRAGWG